MHVPISKKDKCRETLERVHILVGIVTALITVFVLLFVAFWRYPKLKIDVHIDKFEFIQINAKEELLNIKLRIYNNTRERDVTVRPYGEVIIDDSRLGLVRCSTVLQSQTENPIDFFIPSGRFTTLLMSVSNSSLSQVAERSISLSDLIGKAEIKVAVDVEGRKIRNKKWTLLKKHLLTGSP